MGLPMDWTNGMSPEDKESFLSTLSNSTIVTSRIKVILFKKREELYRMQVREAEFTDASWAYKQAYYNGRISAIEEVLKLFGALETKD